LSTHGRFEIHILCDPFVHCFIVLIINVSYLKTFTKPVKKKSIRKNVGVKFLRTSIGFNNNSRIVRCLFSASETARIPAALVARSVCYKIYME